MYLVYLLPLLLIVVVALAIFAPPVLAVLVFIAFQGNPDDNLARRRV